MGLIGSFAIFEESIVRTILSTLINKRIMIFCYQATYLVQGTPLIGNVCTTLAWKLVKGTRLMAVPNGKNQTFLTENPVSSI